MLNKNEFGTLVRAHRKQRGWTQEELAEKWGHSRAYISQIEGGQRKLESIPQVMRLADILEIPQEKLEEVGRGFPERKMRGKSSAQTDDAILQLLLAPSRDMVKLSYMIWLTDQHPMIERKLQDLIANLDAVLPMYRGTFKKPAQQLLAYAHQMIGKIAFDRLDYVSATGHFSEMIDLGRELSDADIIALGMVRQGDVLRKRGRYETALKCFEAAKPYADAADLNIQGIRLINIARSYYFLGDEQNFLKAINPALEAAAQIGKEGNDSLAYWFNLDVVLQFQASGYTALQKPKKALEIYKEIERRLPSRPLRDRGAYTIEKARAYLELGDLENGMKSSLRGLKLASQYHSKRHVARLEATYHRLQTTPFGKDKRLCILRDALREAQRAQIDW
ncbi:MAG TPA: helix-turn-helix domain-containing protein [Ktedonobacteraceae bacterium]|nr:helix-turn-helix domain-containing protein [Ktedonobacteraceae bacterium]